MTFAINPRPTIMVVDDDDDIRFVMSELLRREGYTVIEAANATDAEEGALEQLPDLILMDLRMPGVDGLSALWKLREHPETSTIPVVIVSAHDAFDLRAEAAAVGCAGYLTKPLAVEELKDLVDSIVTVP